MPVGREDRSAAVDALRDLAFAVQAFREGAASHFGVGMRESQAAAHLVTHGQLSAGDLSRLLVLTPSTITHLLGRMHRAGLAVSEADPVDQRRTVVRPTNRAVAMVAEIREWLDSCFDSLESSGIALDAAVTVIDHLRAGLRDARLSNMAPAPTRQSPTPTRPADGPKS